MAVVLTPLGKFVKWVIVPLCAAFIGYVLIGPRLGKRTPPKPQNTLSEQGKKFRDVRGIER